MALTIIKRFAPQGHAPFSTAHREPGSAPGRSMKYAKMTPAETLKSRKTLRPCRSEVRLVGDRDMVVEQMLVVLRADIFEH
jgi:hypothetical protein